MPELPPHNRLGLNYRKVPARKVIIDGGIIDAHNHTRDPALTQIMVDAANAYGISSFYTMCPLEHAPALAEKFAGKFKFIAIPDWKSATASEAFITDWLKRLDAFAAPPLNSRLIKFHMAPGTQKRWGINLDHPLIQRVADHAYKLGYHFMSHFADPKAWFYGTGNYADGSFGSFDSQFAMLERFLEKYPDRIHLGAHMGGSLENIDALAKRFDKFPHYVVDTSATKWIVRAVAEQSVQAVKDFIIHYQDRIIFGSDLVVGDKYDWDHYASRYWVHQKLWEEDYRDQSPIDDPDAGKGFDPATGTFDAKNSDGVPRLVGLDLPNEVLVKIYRGNALRWLP